VSTDPLLTSLLAWYRNNGTDWSGNGRTLSDLGTAHPSTTTGLGGVAAAAALIPAGDCYLDSGDVPFSTPVSLNVWIKHTGTTDWFSVFQVGFGPPGNASAGFFNFSNSTLGGGTPDLFASHVQGTDDFTMLTITYDDTRLRFYINGTYVGGQTGAFGFSTDPAAIRIFGPSSVDGALQFAGVWSRALNDGGVSVGNQAAAESDIARLYNGGAGFDPIAFANAVVRKVPRLPATVIVPNRRG
jgi:hypothetical protein